MHTNPSLSQDTHFLEGSTVHASHWPSSPRWHSNSLSLHTDHVHICGDPRSDLLVVLRQPYLRACASESTTPASMQPTFESDVPASVQTLRESMTPPV